MECSDSSGYTRRYPVPSSPYFSPCRPVAVHGPGAELRMDSRELGSGRQADTENGIAGTWDSGRDPVACRWPTLPRRDWRPLRRNHGLCPCASLPLLSARTSLSLWSRAHRPLVSPLGAPSPSLAWDVVAGDGHLPCSAAAPTRGPHVGARHGRKMPSWGSALPGGRPPTMATRGDRHGRRLLSRVVWCENHVCRDQARPGCHDTQHEGMARLPRQNQIPGGQPTSPGVAASTQLPEDPTAVACKKPEANAVLQSPCPPSGRMGSI